VDATLGHAMHFHPDSMVADGDGHRFQLGRRLGTDEDGISKALDLNVSPNMDLGEIVAVLETKMSDLTLMSL
jgi:hypothetical protein